MFYFNLTQVSNALHPADKLLRIDPLVILFGLEVRQFLGLVTLLQHEEVLDPGAGDQALGAL